MMYIEFTVTVCLGRGDGGDVCVDVSVSDEEYELLLQCCREDRDIGSYDGLSDLCRRIEEAAQSENESCMYEFGYDEEIDYSTASYMISMPDEIIRAVEEEEEDEEEEK